jgi:hypothetical protein
MQIGNFFWLMTQLGDMDASTFKLCLYNNQKSAYEKERKEVLRTARCCCYFQLGCNFAILYVCI